MLKIAATFLHCKKFCYLAFFPWGVVAIWPHLPSGYFNWCDIRMKLTIKISKNRMNAVPTKAVPLWNFVAKLPTVTKRTATVTLRLFFCPLFRYLISLLSIEIKSQQNADVLFTHYFRFFMQVHFTAVVQLFLKHAIFQIRDPQLKSWLQKNRFWGFVRSRLTFEGMRSPKMQDTSSMPAVVASSC